MKRASVGGSESRRKLSFELSKTCNRERILFHLNGFRGAVVVEGRPIFSEFVTWRARILYRKERGRA